MFNLKKSLSICLKKSGFEKSLGIGLEKILSRKKVLEIFGLEKSLGIGLNENIGLGTQWSLGPSYIIWK